ncbi:MAG TPA: fatty acyl-AMP ligase [Polyangiaceae bacterium]|nr:fatty acyl-AMP ligase [Polyangiaceae bacterium]
MNQTQDHALGSCTTLGALLRARAARAERRETGGVWDITLLFPREELPLDLEAKANERKLALSYQELLHYSERAAAVLRAAGVVQGSRVVLVLPTGFAWLVAFFGCQLLGAIPVPLMPPWSIDQLATQRERIERVVSIVEAAVMVLDPQLRSVLGTAPSQCRCVTGQELFAGDASGFVAIAGRSDDPAFIQFTSGSTAEPKGVVISHGAALANCSFIGRRLGVGPHDVGCSWLPLFHDMGLIGHLLVPLYFGIRSVLLPPEVFARQPRTWLEAVTEYRATVITGPNSAYDVCASKIVDRDLAALDLSTVRAALCGAEPILAGTLRRFAERFASVGFRADSMMPVYGLAEATLAVTLSAIGQSTRIERFDRTALETERRAVSVSDTDADSPVAELVGVGRPDREQSLRIVDDRGNALPERHVGLIEVSGPSVMSEYFRNPKATNAVLKGGFINTGDLGFLLNGDLFVVGRSKDTIIKAGRNLHPYDIEAAAATVAGIRKGRVVAFGMRNEAIGTEDVALICETRRPKAQHKELERAVRAAVFRATAVRVDLLRLVEPGVLLKTSSGKLRRNAVRERLENGTLQRMPVPWSLRVRALLAKLRGVAREAREPRT